MRRRRKDRSFYTPVLLHALIHRSAWKKNSANFDCQVLSEVRRELRKVQLCLWWKATPALAVAG
jgi:hypothetical protein